MGNVILLSQFLPRDAILARYICCRRVRLSVRLSVCMSQAGTVLKRLNVESHNQRHTIAHGF